MILYSSELSNYCSKVRFLIHYKKLKIKLISPPGGYGSSEFKKINPLGTIPFLKTKKSNIFDSQIINEYLNNLYPNPPMLSKNFDVNLKIRLLSNFHDQKLEPAIRYFFKFKKNSNFKNDLIYEGFNVLKERLNILEKLISSNKYIASNTISLADCAFPSWLALFNIFNKKFNNKIILGLKTHKYFDNIINDDFMSHEYNRYYQIADKWSKDTLIQNF